VTPALLKKKLEQRASQSHRHYLRRRLTSLLALDCLRSIDHHRARDTLGAIDNLACLNDEELEELYRAMRSR